MPICKQIYIHTTYMYACTCTYIKTHECLCAYTYIQTYLHTDIPCIYIHICIQTLHKFSQVNHKKCYQTNAYIYMSLLQITLMPIIPRLPRPATLLFNRLAEGLMPNLVDHPYYAIMIRVTLLHSKTDTPN